MRDLFELALICLMVVVGLGAVYVLLLPIIMLTSMFGGVASAIASEKASEKAPGLSGPPRQGL